MSTKKPDKSMNTFPLTPEQDPIVEILRLAYRRGLAIRREQEKQAKAIEQQDSDNEEKQDVPEDLSEAK